MTNLWWQNHRLLRRGMTGSDVERIQRALNDFGISPRLEPDGIFGGNTETAVRNFQAMMKLLIDGEVGPVTYSVLVEGSYRFELARPPFVVQGIAFLCWAASLESVLRGAWPGRKSMTMAALRTKYASHLDSRGGIGPKALRDLVGKDLRFKEVLVGKHVRAEHLLKLLRNRFPLLMVDSSTGIVMHTRVLYGVRIRRGAIDLMLMNPMKGYETAPIGTIQSFFKIGFLAPNETRE